MRTRTAWLVAASLTTFSASGLSAELSTVLRASAEFGGEKLATVVYYDGYQETTRAGDGLQFAVGVGLTHSPTWYSQATIGYKIGGTTARNGDLDLSSVPLEIMTFHKTPRWRAGFGVNYVSGLELDSSGVLDGLDAEFEDSMGFIAEWDWLFPQDDRFYVGIRATAIDYETSRTRTQINGNNIGFVFGMNL